MESIKKHKHILITGDNGNALGVLRAIAEFGIQPIVIFFQEHHFPFLLSSRYLQEVYFVNTYAEAFDLLLKKFGNEKYLPFVYTSDDWIESILDNKYDQLKNKFYFFNASGNGIVNNLMNKDTICEIAQSCGFRIPQKEMVETGVLPQNVSYPIITKTLMSIMGAWKGDVYVCYNENELKIAYEKIKSPRLLLQEYIHKKNELAIMGFSINGGDSVYMPYQLSYFRTPDSAYGSYMYFKPLQEEALKQKIQHLIKKCNYSGCFEIEFLVDKNDELVFLEVNFRFSYWNYALTYGGVNYPIEWAKATLNGKIDESSYKLKDYFTAIDEPSDYGQVVANKQMSVFAWLREMINADVKYIYNKKDKKPAFMYWKSVIKSIIQYKLKSFCK